MMVELRRKTIITIVLILFASCLLMMFLLSQFWQQQRVPTRLLINNYFDCDSRNLQSNNTINTTNIINTTNTTNTTVNITKPNFSVKYVGQFQHLRDSFCLAEDPVLFALCQGESRFINATETVQCTELIERDNGWSQIRCVNTCTNDTACQNVYLALGSTFQEGPYAEIYFECYGDNLKDVDAYFKYASSEMGTCASTTSSSTRTFHVARLGVLCQDEYVLDDYYVECGGYYFGETSDSPPGSPGDELVCFSGKNCEGQSCTFSHNDTFVRGITQNFLECVDSINPIDTSTGPPTGTEVDLFETTATFHAAWATFFRGLFSEDCSEHEPIQKIQLVCSNREGEIKFVNTTHSSVSCNQTEKNILECIDSGTAHVNQFTGVIYECSGPELPTTTIEYPEQEVVCDGTTVEATVSHLVQIGVYCSDTASYYFDDSYFECGSIEHKIDWFWLDEFGEDYGVRYTCSESVSLQSTDVQTIPKLTMTTDLYWEENPRTSCFILENAFIEESTPAPAPTPETSPTPSPTPEQSPLKPALATSPTSTLNSPTSPPSTTDSIYSQQSPPPIYEEEEKSSSSSSAIGAAVGGSIAAILIVGLIGFLAIYFRRKHSDSVDVKIPDVKPPDETGSDTGRYMEDGKHMSTPQRLQQRENVSHNSRRPNVDFVLPDHGSSQNESHQEGTRKDVSGFSTDMNTESIQSGHQSHSVENVRSSSGSHRTSETRTHESATPSGSVHFKDQVRTVIGPLEVPIVEGVAIPVVEEPYWLPTTPNHLPQISRNSNLTTPGELHSTRTRTSAESEGGRYHYGGIDP